MASTTMLSNSNAELPTTTPISSSNAVTSTSISTTPFQTIVFSRKSTYNGPPKSSSADEREQNEQQQLPSPLSQLVYQTDRYGNYQTKAINQQQPPYLVATPSSAHLKKIQQVSSRQQKQSQPIQQQQSNKSLTKFLSNVYSVFGLAAGTSSSETNSANNNNTHVAEIKNKEELQKQRKCNVATSNNNNQKGLLPTQLPKHLGKKCLVLDLDETLVHSCFRPTETPADYIIPVEIEGVTHRVYVSKRPGVDEFLKEMGKIYEIVVYTASLSKYADPLLDKLDIHKVISYRLFREHCVHHQGTYVKDLSLLDRDISQTIIIDNSPLAYMFHPQNAIGCSNYIDDPKDNELKSIQDFLINIQHSKDVREQLQFWSPETVAK